MLLLLKTFLDVIALRKGPDSIPGSWLVFMVALFLMAVSSYVAVALIDNEEPRNHALTFFAYALGLLFYAAVIYVSGKAGRVLQAITTIIACGSIITVFFVGAFAVLSPVVGQKFAALVATLIIFWSVPVEGHIMARTLDQSWFVGIVIAIAAFVLQFGLQSAFVEPG